MSDCFFEYPARWSQLYEYLLSGDDARVKQALAHLEARDRALEDHLRNRPCGGGGSATIVFADPLDEDETDAGPQTTDTPARLPLTLGETTVVRLSAGIRVDASQFDAVLDAVRASMWLVDHETDTEYRSSSGYAPAHSGSTHGNPPHVRLTVPFVWTGELAAGTYNFGMRVATDTDGGTNAPIVLAELWLDAIY